MKVLAKELNMHRCDLIVGDFFLKKCLISKTLRAEHRLFAQFYCGHKCIENAFGYLFQVGIFEHFQCLGVFTGNKRFVISS
jgi:hypothetical protein